MDPLPTDSACLQVREDATDDEVVALARRLSEVPLGDVTVNFEIDRDSVIIARAALLMGRDC
jgi:hypothetical protein